MQVRKQYFINSERGVSLSGLIFALVILGLLAVVAMKVVPTYTEYRTIQGAIVKAKTAGGSAAEMQRSFDKQAEIDGVSAIAGRDLVITKDGGESEISFAYEKRVPLTSNVSLVINYAGTTDRSGVVAAQSAASAN